MQAPIGQRLVTSDELDLNGLGIRTYVNGELEQWREEGPRSVEVLVAGIICAVHCPGAR